MAGSLALVALSFVSAIGPARDGVAHLAHLGGAVAGFLLVKSGWMPSYGGGWGGGAYGGVRRAQTGRGGASGGGRGFGGVWRRRGQADATRPGGPAARRRGQRDDRDDRAGSGRITAAFEARKARQRAAREHAELDKVDAVLDKISAEGIDSLTAEERELLDRVSRQTKAN